MTKEQNLNDVARVLARISQKGENPVSEETVAGVLGRCLQALNPDEAEMLMQLSAQAIEYADENHHPEVTEVRPQVLECDVVRFQNNKEKWVAFVGLLDGYPYEIFTGVLDDDEGIILPKNISRGHIIKNTDENGNKRYDFQFENKRGYKVTIEGLSEKFNKEYWNYAKLISGILRHGMPIPNVVELIGKLNFDNDSITTWSNGVARALKRYIKDGTETEEVCPDCGGKLVYNNGCKSCPNCGWSKCS